MGMILLPSTTSAARRGKSFLDDLCDKCEYCETDSTCSGCKECSRCETRQQEGCRVCREKETGEKCVARCKKGCRICAGKDGKGLDSCINREKEDKNQK